MMWYWKVITFTSNLIPNRKGEIMDIETTAQLRKEEGNFVLLTCTKDQEAKLADLVGAVVTVRNDCDVEFVEQK